MCDLFDFSHFNDKHTVLIVPNVRVVCVYEYILFVIQLQEAIGWSVPEGVCSSVRGLPQHRVQLHDHRQLLHAGQRPSPPT